MLNYSLCKALKAAGFPQRHKNYEYGMGYDDKGNVVYFNPCCEYWSNAVPIVDIPSLSELIEACGEWFESLNKGYDVFMAEAKGVKIGSYHKNALFGLGKTPEEAVANLYIALNS